MSGLLLALFAGIATIAAPCTLPLLPILLGASLGRPNTTRPIWIAFGFVASFTSVALLLGAITKALNVDPNTLRNFAVAMLVVFGILMIWPKSFEELSMRMPSISGSSVSGRSLSDNGNLSGFVLGTTLGLVWTPCAGPVLGAILTVIATSSDTRWAGVQLLFYALGAAIPMLAIAYGGQKITAHVRSFARAAPQLQKAFGVAVIAFAIATYAQYDTLIVAWFTQFYPTGLGL